MSVTLIYVRLIAAALIWSMTKRELFDQISEELEKWIEQMSEFPSIRYFYSNFDLCFPSHILYALSSNLLLILVFLSIIL